MIRPERYSGLLLVLLTLHACNRDAPPESQLSDQPAEVKAVVADTSPAGGIDPDSGLVIDGQWELVKAHCGACHSTRLITQNRGDRETWLSLIRWMQDSQGLWQFDAATETAILDYLALNYAPPDTGRRAALDASLMPPNPYGH